MRHVFMVYDYSWVIAQLSTDWKLCVYIKPPAHDFEGSFYRKGSAAYFADASIVFQNKLHSEQPSIVSTATKINKAFCRLAYDAAREVMLKAGVEAKPFEQLVWQNSAETQSSGTSTENLPA